MKTLFFLTLISVSIRAAADQRFDNNAKIPTLTWECGSDNALYIAHMNLVRNDKGRIVAGATVGVPNCDTEVRPIFSKRVPRIVEAETSLFYPHNLLVYINNDFYLVDQRVFPSEIETKGKKLRKQTKCMTDKCIIEIISEFQYEISFIEAALLIAEENRVYILNKKIIAHQIKVLQKYFSEIDFEYENYAIAPEKLVNF